MDTGEFDSSYLLTLALEEKASAHFGGSQLLVVDLHQLSLGFAYLIKLIFNIMELAAQVGALCKRQCLETHVNLLQLLERRLNCCPYLRPRILLDPYAAA